MEIENMLYGLYSLPQLHKFPDAAFGNSVAEVLGYSLNGPRASRFYKILNDSRWLTRFILQARPSLNEQNQARYRNAIDRLQVLREQHRGKPRDKLLQENLKALEELTYLPIATKVLNELRGSGRIVTDPPPPLCKVINELPAWDVYQGLEFEMHKPSIDRKPDPNDLRDLAFACVAIPYCDVVIAEKHLVAIARKLHLERKWRTRLFTLAEAKDRPEAILE